MDTPIGLYTHIIVDHYDRYRLDRKALRRDITLYEQLFNMAVFFNYSLRFLSV
jgi:hypothetical protein